MKTFDKYRLTKKLGEGGMGVVYLGEDALLQRKVAIKLVHQHNIRDEEIKQRFLTEARLTAKLQHPNIATLYNLVQDENQLGMVMEYLEGINLDDFLHKYKPLPPGLAKGIILQVLSGLSYAHKNGVIHRDIKPSNIMITKTGVVKILDFGIARLEGSTRLTQTGKMVGTLHYMAPEQILGQDTTPKSDLYSAGIMLYEMLIGAPPFAGKSDFQLMEAQIKTVPNLSSIKHTTGLHTPLKKALKKDGKLRFESADQFALAIKNEKKNEPFSPSKIQEAVFQSPGKLSLIAQSSGAVPQTSQHSPQPTLPKELFKKIEELPTWIPIGIFLGAILFFSFMLFQQKSKKALALQHKTDSKELVNNEEENIESLLAEKRNAYILDREKEVFDTPEASSKVPTPPTSKMDNDSNNKKDQKKPESSIPKKSSASDKVSTNKKTQQTSQPPIKQENTQILAPAIKEVNNDINQSKSTTQDQLESTQDVSSIDAKNSSNIEKTSSSNSVESKGSKKSISVRIPKNTPFIIALESDVSSETAHTGMPVKFRSVLGLTVDGIQVIEPGAEVYAKVDKVRASNNRKSGRLEIVAQSTVAIRGETIPLYGIFYETGKGNSAITFKKGQRFQVSIKSNTTVYAFQK